MRPSTIGGFNLFTSARQAASAAGHLISEVANPLGQALGKAAKTKVGSLIMGALAIESMGALTPYVGVLGSAIVAVPNMLAGDSFSQAYVQQWKTYIGQLASIGGSLLGDPNIGVAVTDALGPVCDGLQDLISSDGSGVSSSISDFVQTVVGHIPKQLTSAAVKDAEGIVNQVILNPLGNDVQSFATNLVQAGVSAFDSAPSTIAKLAAAVSASPSVATALANQNNPTGAINPDTGTIREDVVMFALAALKKIVPPIPPAINLNPTTGDVTTSRPTPTTTALGIPTAPLADGAQVWAQMDIHDTTQGIVFPQNTYGYVISQTGDVSNANAALADVPAAWRDVVATGSNVPPGGYTFTVQFYQEGEGAQAGQSLPWGNPVNSLNAQQLATAPVPWPPVVENLPANMTFANGSALINTSDQMQVLNDVKNWAQQNPNTPLQLQGSAGDGEGVVNSPAGVGLALATSRAQAVRQWLSGQALKNPLQVTYVIGPPAVNFIPQWASVPIPPEVANDSGPSPRLTTPGGVLTQTITPVPNAAAAGSIGIGAAALVGALRLLLL